MIEWFKQHEALMWWVTGASVVLFILTLVGSVVVIVRMPPDYFTHDKKPPSLLGKKGSGSRTALKVLMNVAGGLFVLIGIAMLLLPGQGVLAIIVGLVLMDIPGKYRLEKWLASKKKVLKAMNWLRGKFGKEELREPKGKGAK